MECIYRSTCNGRDCDKDFCMKKCRLDCLYDNSQLTAVQRQLKVLYTDQDGTDRDEFIKLSQIEKEVVRFVTEGHNLYIHSYICGNGKTSWALRILTSYFNKIWHKSNLGCQGLFICVPRYLLELKSNITSYSAYVDFINKNVLEADIVVWDDIAAKTGSEFELNHLFNFINTRLDLGKCNIFTSNLGKNELPSALGERLASRIGNKSIEVELHGADKRALSLMGGH